MMIVAFTPPFIGPFFVCSIVYITARIPTLQATLTRLLFANVSSTLAEIVSIGEFFSALADFFEPLD